jgi:macrolide transport system ATP-binding/permease protein
MRALRRFLARLWVCTMGRRGEERLRHEIEKHLVLQTEENVRAGLSPAEARRQAMLKFGAVEAIKEEYRDSRGLPLLETLLRDTRHGIWQLRKSPTFAFTATVTLALGIGANTAIYSVAKAVILRLSLFQNRTVWFTSSRVTLANGFTRA